MTPFPRQADRERALGLISFAIGKFDRPDIRSESPLRNFYPSLGIFHRTQGDFRAALGAKAEGIVRPLLASASIPRSKSS